MNIEYKDIKNSKKKICAICERDIYNDGIIIMNNFICESCVHDITLININDVRYNEIKDKIKVTLIKGKL